MQRLRELFRENALLIGIIFFAIILRIIWFNQIHDFDETQYALEAMHMKEGVYDPNLIYYNQGTRYTLLIPQAIIFFLFGFSKITMVSYIFVMAIGQIILIYFLARKIFDTKVGLLATFLLAIFPLDVKYSSVLEADILVSVFAGFGMLLYYNGDLKKAFLAGALFGFAFFTKIFIGFMLLFLFMYEAICEKHWKKYNIMLLGFILLSSPFFLYQYVETGDMMYDFHVQLKVTDAITQFKDNPPHFTYAQTQIGFSTLKKYAKNIFLTTDEDDPTAKVNIYFILFFGFVLYNLHKNNQKIRMLLLWVILAFILLLLITYQQRYLLIIELPIIIGIAYYIGKIQSNTLRYGLLVLLVLISLYQFGQYTIFTPELSYNGQRIMHDEEKFALFLKDYPKKDIYLTNYNELAFFNVYFDFSKSSDDIYGYRGNTLTQFKDLHFVNSSDEIHDGYVIFYGRYLKQDEDNYNYYDSHNLSAFIGHSIPSNWYIIGKLNHVEGTGGALFYVE